MTSKNIEYSGFVLMEDYYEQKINDIVIKIQKKNYNSKTLAYAYKIAELYSLKKSDIIDYVLLKTSNFYSSRYTVDEIKAKLNDPYIEILSENWGVLVWLNHQLDEHIIECEFGNDMQLFYVSLSG